MFIYRLTDILQKRKLKFAVVGGFALALHGAVRGTVDIDIVISLVKKDFETFEAAMSDLGFVAKLPVRATQVYNFRNEYIRERNLIAWSFYNPSSPSEVVDVILSENLARFKVVQIKAGARVIPVASIADLIRMKKKSARPQDLADIEALKELKIGTSRKGKS